MSDDLKAATERLRSHWNQHNCREVVDDVPRSKMGFVEDLEIVADAYLDQRAIPESHPRTADGVPIFIGDTIWAYDPDGDEEDDPEPLGVVSISDSLEYGCVGTHTIGAGDMYEWGNLDVWSTRDAAVASRAHDVGGGSQ